MANPVTFLLWSDNLLASANAVDQYIQRLWETMQSLDQYRDKTTFIISTDHGRGSGLVDWKNHGKNIEGAEDMWMAFLGPDTPPLGERTNCERVTQSQIAATLASLLGEDYHGAVPRSGPVIKDVLPPVNYRQPDTATNQSNGSRVIL